MLAQHNQHTLEPGPGVNLSVQRWRPDELWGRQDSIAICVSIPRRTMLVKVLT
jgi:hypothetical protein